MIFNINFALQVNSSTMEVTSNPALNASLFFEKQMPISASDGSIKQKRQHLSKDKTPEMFHMPSSSTGIKIVWPVSRQMVMVSVISHNLLPV
jgi:hypothetical protein